MLWVGGHLWRRASQPTPVFLPGESPRTEKAGRSSHPVLKERPSLETSIWRRDKTFPSALPHFLVVSQISMVIQETYYTLRHIIQKPIISLRLSGKETACQYRKHKRCEFDPKWERTPGGGNGNRLQYSCLGNPMDRGAWQDIVHRVAKSQTQLKQLSIILSIALSSLRCPKTYQCPKGKEFSI